MVASTLHKGPYDQLVAVYERMQGWLAEHGHTMAGPPREIYLNNPEMVARNPCSRGSSSRLRQASRHGRSYRPLVRWMCWRTVRSIVGGLVSGFQRHVLEFAEVDTAGFKV